MSTKNAPELATLRNVPVLKVGRFNASTGPFEITKADLAAAVKAAQSLPAPRVKIGHRQKWSDGEPALGAVENLRLSADGATLLGDLVGLPAWLAKVAESAYPNRSIEAEFDYQAADGTTHPFVLTGLALLGTEQPAVGELPSLKDVQDLYGLAAARQRRHVVIATSAEGKMMTVRAADPADTPATSSDDAQTLDGDQWTAVCQMAGVEETVTVDELLAALAGRLEASAGDVKAGRGRGIWMSHADHQALKIEAEKGRQAIEAAAKSDRERVIGDAVRSGKIAAASRSEWTRLMEADAGATKRLLASLPDQGAVPLSEIGHASQPEVMDDPQAMHKGVFEQLTGQPWGK
ncbi:hypothetical protein ACW2Q0_18930 [Nocardia sp. R16R-3T]